MPSRQVLIHCDSGAYLAWVLLHPQFREKKTITPTIFGTFLYCRTKMRVLNKKHHPQYQNPKNFSEYQALMRINNKQTLSYSADPTTNSEAMY